MTEVDASRTIRTESPDLASIEGTTIGVFGAKGAGKTILWSMVHRGSQEQSLPEDMTTYLRARKVKVSVPQKSIGTPTTNLVNQAFHRIMGQRRLPVATMEASYLSETSSYTFEKKQIFLHWFTRSSVLGTVTFFDISGEWFDRYDVALDRAKKSAERTEVPTLYDYLAKCRGLLFLIDCNKLAGDGELMEKFQASIDRLRIALGKDKNKIDIPTVFCITKADSLFCNSVRLNDKDKYYKSCKDLFDTFFDVEEFQAEYRKFCSARQNISCTDELFSLIEKHYEKDMIKLCFQSALGVITASKSEDDIMRKCPNLMRGQGGEPRVILGQIRNLKRGEVSLNVQPINLVEAFEEMFKMIKGKGAC